MKTPFVETFGWINWDSLSEGVIMPTKLILDLWISTQKEREINLTEVRIQINVDVVIFEVSGLYWFIRLDIMDVTFVSLCVVLFSSLRIVSIHVIKRSGNMAIFACSNPGGMINWRFVPIVLKV